MTSYAKGIFSWAIIAFLGFCSVDVNAGHILGTDLTYTYVSPNTYIVRVRWYRDCQGLPANSQISICYSSVNAGISNTLVLPMMPAGQYYLPNFPYWPSMQTSCFGGNATGIERTTYEGILTLPTAATDWIISYSTFPQNIGINQNFMYVSSKIDNVNYPQNSSSFFMNDPTFIYCVNQPAWDNFASADIDGDSLSYHLIPSLDNTTVCPPAPFLNPLAPFNPLQSSTPIVMDSTNGSLTFSPTTIGMAMVSARVDEFRNGLLINSTTIEHVLYVVTGCVISGMEEQPNLVPNLHPNPANDQMILEINKVKPLFIEATDISGKTSEIDFVSVGASNYELNVKMLSKGIYSLKVVTENGVAVERFVKL